MSPPAGWLARTQQRADDLADDDVLETRDKPGRDRVRVVWVRAPRRLRAAVLVAGTVVIVVIAATVSLQQWTHLRAERRLNDTVGIGAALEVSSNSMTPRGGRVDYSVTIRNEGPRRVRVTGVSIDQGGLRIADLGLGSDEFVRAGAATNIRLSVHLDCDTLGSADTAGGLPGVVKVRPLSGSLHRVSLTFAQASPLIDLAQTLCNISPHNASELSGPILKGNAG
jgi:hypothetical protein